LVIHRRVQQKLMVITEEAAARPAPADAEPRSNMQGSAVWQT
jgi:hypothetical protein